MNTHTALVIGLLCTIATSANFKWHPVLNVSKSEPVGSSTYQSLPDGSIHMFWGRTVNETSSLMYQVFFPNSTLVTKASVESLFKGHQFYSISAQVSDDGEHVLVAYIGRIGYSSCLDNLDSPCEKVYFIESLDGGKTWSDPLALDRGRQDYSAHSYPSILLDNDTGRVFISYTATANSNSDERSNPRIAIREPGKELFTITQLAARSYCSVKTLIGFTVDRVNAKKYVHAVAEIQYYAAYRSEIFYTRSKDNGKTWTYLSKVEEKASGCYPNTLVTNTRVDEAGVHIRYKSNLREELLKRSKDHGERFGRSSAVSSTCHPNMKMLLCGRSGRGIALLAHFGRKSQKPYASYSPLSSRQFVELPYAFEKLPYEDYEYYGVSCSSVMSSKYLISLLVKPKGENLLFAARGILNLD